MFIKLDKLNQRQLDYAVHAAVHGNRVTGKALPRYDNWQQCGSLIQYYRVSIKYSKKKQVWTAEIKSKFVHNKWRSKNPLDAIRRAIIEYEIGIALEVPEKI